MALSLLRCPPERCLAAVGRQGAIGLAAAVLLVVASGASASAQIVGRGPFGTIDGTAVVVAGGATCPLVRFPDGRIFALQGPSLPVTQLVPGTAVRVVGQAAMFSICMQGQALEVTFIQITTAPP